MNHPTLSPLPHEAYPAESRHADEAKVCPQLFVHEWLAILMILGFLLLLTFIALIGQAKDLQTLSVGASNYLKVQELEFHIEGAVAKPGAYRVKTGTKLKEALELAEPLLEADLRKLRSNSRIRHNQKVVVPKKEMIFISIAGAVQEEISLSVPKGTRLNELDRYVAFTANADCRKVCAKRYLKDQEKIIVPEKSVQKASSKRMRKKM